MDLTRTYLRTRNFFFLQKNISSIKLLTGYSVLLMAAILVFSGVIRNNLPQLSNQQVIVAILETIILLPFVVVAWYCLSFRAQREYVLWNLYRKIGPERFFWANLATYFRLFKRANTYGELFDAINGFFWLRSSRYCRAYLQLSGHYSELSCSIDDIAKEWYNCQSEFARLKASSQIRDNEQNRQMVLSHFYSAFQFMPVNIRQELSIVEGETYKRQR